MTNITIRYSSLIRELAFDVGFSRNDVRYLVKRTEAEGLRFLTVTLPKLAKAVLSGIEAGNFAAFRPTDFAWKGRSLRYFRSLLNRIFDPVTGSLLPEPDAPALASLRQVCEYAYKLSVEEREEDVEKAAHRFISSQHAVQNFRYDQAWLDQLRKNFETYYAPLARLSPHDILSVGPRYGPGTFVGSGDSHPTWMSLAEWKLLPESHTGTCNQFGACYSGLFRSYPGAPGKIHVVDENRTAEVLFVPKDSRGPRVITREPLHQLRATLAFLDCMTPLMERCTNGRINFRDQLPNQKLACEGSISGRWATLDLKDASDRVGIRFAQRVFRNAPGIYFFLRRFRSKFWTLRLPNGEGRFGRMHSVAGMGSGLTFPLLALTCHLSVCSSIAMKLRIPYQRVMKKVYVYGDDVIVPTEWYGYAVTGLEDSGLLVNTEKSYYRGPFRESCGADYLSGVRVTPTRLRLSGAGRGVLKPQLVQRRILTSDTGVVVGLITHSRELNKAYLYRAEGYIIRKVSGSYPLLPCEDGSNVLGRRVERLTAEEISDAISLPTTVIRSDGSLTYMGLKTGPERIRSQWVCPYKHLGRFFKAKDLDGFPLFGEVAFPRSLTLEVKPVTLDDLRGYLPLQE